MPIQKRELPRFSADAVTGAADALPVNEILRGVSRTEQELLRLVLLVPEAHDRVLDGIGPSGADACESQFVDLVRAAAQGESDEDQADARTQVIFLVGVELGRRIGGAR